jgi:hypothetical protein
MSKFENELMEELRKIGVRNWWRYVDDIFATLDNREQAARVLAFLNEKHPNIRFTIEYESNERLPFLDTAVRRRHDGYYTTMYRKPTFTGVYLNWSSLTARRYKIGLISCLAERAWRIVSDQQERLIELERLRTILARNDYPPDVVETTIARFLERKARQANPAEPEKEIKRFLKLPYVSRKCEDFAFRLKQLVSSFFPQVEFNVAFQAPMTIGKMFPFKDRILNALDQSVVVYKVKCLNCEAEYIGKTTRILHHRIYEHRTKSESAIRQHLQLHEDHHIDFNGVQILDTADTLMKLSVKELLHIIRHNPSLNKQLGTQSSFEIKTLLIQAYPQFRPAK